MCNRAALYIVHVLRDVVIISIMYNVCNIYRVALYIAHVLRDNQYHVYNVYNTLIKVSLINNLIVNFS